MNVNKRSNSLHSSMKRISNSRHFFELLSRRRVRRVRRLRRRKPFRVVLLLFREREKERERESKKKRDETTSNNFGKDGTLSLLMVCFRDVSLQPKKESRDIVERERER
jgi:hypothetical protein